MQKALLDIRSVLSQDGIVDASALPVLREVVDRFPFYHAARMLLLRLLYQQRDSQFNEELRIASLYLPSRARIYQEIEGDSMRPSAEPERAMTGATHSRKSSTPVDVTRSHGEDRTGTLIDSFLQTTPSVLMDSRSGRPVDATTDYISYLLQEEAQQSAQQSGATTPISESITDSASPRQSLIEDFISTQGDGRIRLSEKKDSELQKPTLVESDNTDNQGALTETLARIYIKQGKFEQAIKIIRQLSLKYPKKNRYFADQIRFLEKLIINNQAK